MHINDKKEPLASTTTSSSSGTAKIIEKVVTCDAEKTILEKQIETISPKSTYFSIFRYATRMDVFIYLVGCFFSIAQGVALPMFVIIIGRFGNDFRDYAAEEGNADEFMSSARQNALYFVYIGIAILGTGVIQAFLLVDRGEVISARIRKAYLRSVLRQNIGFFDKMTSGEITAKIIGDTSTIQDSISEKVGIVLAGITTFITCIVISFIHQWRLACIMLPGIFFIGATMIVSLYFMVRYTIIADRTFTVGAGVAEEALRSIRNTVAFGLQKTMVQRFDVYLTRARDYGHGIAISSGFMLALLYAALFFIYALAFWEGSRTIARGDTNIGNILVVLLSTIIGAFQLGNIGHLTKNIASGIGAIRTINATIKRVPIIDALSDEGTSIENLQGDVEFHNVKFRYPSRPDVLVLPDFSLKVPKGKTIALVGASGSGKSTCVALLERFYLPLQGQITLDGVDISELNIHWLRRQIGYVSQEPTLFAASIYDNLAYGLQGTEWEDAPGDLQRQRIIDACKQANAWDFIQMLPDGLDTSVGDRGFLLSGGQKQRIAIARAIVKDPKVMLLDEATSALDTKSEGIVQDALDKASKDRTTIIIAHRLSTIRSADCIVVMNNGQIVEKGTHTELLSQEGTYWRLVESQKIHRTVVEQAQVSEQTPEALVEEDEKVEISRNLTDISQSSHFKIKGTEIKPVKIVTVVTYLLHLNRKYTFSLIIGIIGALILGYGFPALAIVVGQTISAIMVPESQYDEMLSRIGLLSGMIFLLGCIQFISAGLMIYYLVINSNNLLRNVRLGLFRQFLRMDVAFYDIDTNTPGALTSILTKEGQAIDGLGGVTAGTIFRCIVGVVGAIITGIPFNWRLGLVGTACVPIVMGCGFLRVRVLIKLEERAKVVYQSSGTLASQFAAAVRTVQSLTREEPVCEMYGSRIDQQVANSKIPVFLSAVAYGCSEGFSPFIQALVFWYGSKLLSEGKATVTSYFTVYIALIVGVQAAGTAFSYSASIGKGTHAASTVYRLLTAEPDIDTESTEGIHLEKEDVEGNIELRDIAFRYPTRPEVPVLSSLNLRVKRGQYIALVGPSGCGKSTTVGLVERFYDPLKGTVFLDGVDISTLNIQSYRKCVSLVQQEPTLYPGTIRENILYGWHDIDTSQVSDEVIYEAARQANIHDFIMSLPDGYETETGSAGALLSGGQKQRVAIARALIRNPRILLLDEATSALDSESEKVVQTVLDEAAKGRTTIAIAHRLSTIQKADCIYVFEKGRIAESGTHDELMQLNGHYAELVKLQSLEM